MTRLLSTAHRFAFTAHSKQDRITIWMTFMLVIVGLCLSRQEKVHAATVTYHMQHSSGVTVAPGVITNWSGCKSKPTTTRTTLMDTNAFDCADDEVNLETHDIHFAVYSNTAYTMETAITGVSFDAEVVDRGSGGWTLSAQLFYVDASGTKTDIGNPVTQFIPCCSKVNLNLDLSSQNGQVPAGSKLGSRVENVGGSTSTRVRVGSSFGGNLIVQAWGLPTLVKMRQMVATAGNDGVFLRWHRGLNVNNLGWHVYREVDGERVRLTPGLIAGSAFMFGPGIRLNAGNTYRWWDPAGLDTDRYGIEDHDLYTESLAEALLKAEQGGAVAVWASSGLTAPGEQAVMHHALVGTLFGEEPLTLGEAIRRAKATVTDRDVQRTWMLFGDPTLRLKSPATRAPATTTRPTDDSTLETNTAALSRGSGVALNP